MFPARYFSPRYWAPVFWAKIGQDGDPETASTPFVGTSTVMLQKVANSTITLQRTAFSILIGHTATPTDPAFPTNLAASDDEVGQITLTWDSVVGAITYQLYQNSVDDPNTSSLVSSSILSSPYVYTTADPNPFYFWIRVVTATGQSAYSEPAIGGQIV